jgi:hypothetical protein
MAKLSLEVTETLWKLKHQALEIVEEATATEYSLFDLAKKLAYFQINGRKHLTIHLNLER